MSDHLNEINGTNSCPKCSSKTVLPVKYTWWGGILGPKLLHHAKCVECHYTFNSKTGKSNTTGIILYTLALFVIAFALFFMLRLLFL